MSTVIEVDDVWKKYRLGIIGTGTLRHDFERWWHRVRGKPDPYSKVDQTANRRTEVRGQKSEREHQSLAAVTAKGYSSDGLPELGDDEMWALRGVSFEVKQGEILGIIGRNGAGKSTLLKILSRVTAPTSGEVRVKGRIASLLEVGTGFHPELTGRENIFLNGAILGMTKAEIRKKFDEIVDFAGVERYMDTPVKRYSQRHVCAAGVCRGGASGTGDFDLRRSAGRGRRRVSKEVHGENAGCQQARTNHSVCQP